jgi:hypothetical protein
MSFRVLHHTRTDADLASGPERCRHLRILQVRPWLVCRGPRKRLVQSGLGQTQTDGGRASCRSLKPSEHLWQHVSACRCVSGRQRPQCSTRQSHCSRSSVAAPASSHPKCSCASYCTWSAGHAGHNSTCCTSYCALKRTSYASRTTIKHNAAHTAPRLGSWR